MNTVTQALPSIDLTARDLARARWSTRAQFVVLGIVSGAWGAHVPSVKQAFALNEASLEKTSAALEELSSMTRRNSDNASEANALMAQADEAVKAAGNDVVAVSAALSAGALHGARGNSGVILSQILRGVADVVAEAALQRGEDRECGEITAPEFTAASKATRSSPAGRSSPRILFQ